jgi:hypothetical protein
VNRYLAVNTVVLLALFALIAWGLRQACPNTPWYVWLVVSPALLLVSYLLVHRVTSAITNPIVATLTCDRLWEPRRPEKSPAAPPITVPDVAHAERSGVPTLAGGNH